MLFNVSVHDDQDIQDIGRASLFLLFELFVLQARRMAQIGRSPATIASLCSVLQVFPLSTSCRVKGLRTIVMHGSFIGFATVREGELVRFVLDKTSECPRGHKQSLTPISQVIEPSDQISSRGYSRPHGSLAKFRLGEGDSFLHSCFHILS